MGNKFTTPHYTKLDENIIEKILREKPDWTLLDIQKALPYHHTLANIKNKLQQYVSPKELEKHMSAIKVVSHSKAPVQTQSLPEKAAPKPAPKPSPKKPTKPKDYFWTEEEKAIMEKHVETLSPSDDRWLTLFPGRTKTAIISRLYIIKRKLKKQKAAQKEVDKPKERKHGWLKSDYDLFVLALGEYHAEEKSLDLFLTEIQNLLDEKKSKDEIKAMKQIIEKEKPPKAPKKAPPEKPSPVPETPKDVPAKIESQKSISKLSKMEQLQMIYKAVEALDQDATYDILINFGDGLIFQKKRP